MASSDAVARELNGRIRRQSERFLLGADTRVTFVCECGCFGELDLTLAAYDAHEGPLLAPGHRPLEARAPDDLVASAPRSVPG